MSPDDVIRNLFPTLRSTGHRITSPQTRHYNCLAWAAGETDRRWEPFDPHYWPSEADREQTIPAFVAAYASRRYVECDNGNLEEGYEKIAIYAVNDVPKHAARQLPNGSWTSKLGNLEDIEHPTVEGVKNNTYGNPVRFMKRLVLVEEHSA